MAIEFRFMMTLHVNLDSGQHQLSEALILSKLRVLLVNRINNENSMKTELLKEFKQVVYFNEFQK